MPLPIKIDLIKAQAKNFASFWSPQWAQFLRNHDELDLGRLNNEQRAKVFERFAPEKEMQLYDRGIRRRLATMLGDRRHLELAYSVMFSLPGTPVIRYSDEIGMGDDLPVIDKGVYSYNRVNVEAQRRDPHSLFNWTASMIRLRHECPEIGWGTWEILPTNVPQMLAMRYDWRGNSLVMVHNFDDKAHEIQIAPNVPHGETLIDLMHEDQSEADASGIHHIALDAYDYRWYRVGDLNYALHRTA